MKTYKKLLFLVLVAPVLWYGCSRDVVTPTFRGNIKGRVISSKTGKGIPGVSVTTSPGTDAIVTDKNGRFAFKEVPVGNYIITAKKQGYQKTTVSVHVRRNETATANITMESVGTLPSGAYIQAKVTNFFNNSRNDSSFVDVDYLVKNTSNTKLIRTYKVTFKIYATENTFLAQISGDSLDSGEQEIGSFTTYIHNATADSVAVLGVYAPN